MNQHFVAETIEEKIPLWVSCANADFLFALTKHVEAAGFRVFPKGEKREGDPYAFLLVDVGQPLEELRSAFQGIPQGVKLLLVSFDTSRKKDIAVPHLIEIAYAQVFSPFSPALCRLDEMIRKVIWDETVMFTGGECRPLWYEDVCSHVAQILVGGKITEATYVGERHVSLTTFLTSLRVSLGITEGKKEKNISTTNVMGKTIPSRDVQGVVEQVAVFYEGIRPVSQDIRTSGKRGENKGPVPPTSLSKNDTRKKRVRLFIFGGSFAVGSVIALSYFWYGINVRALQKNLRTLVYEKKEDIAHVSTTLNGAKTQISWISFFGALTDPLTSMLQQEKEGSVAGVLPLVSSGVEGYSELSQAQSELVSGYKMFVGGQKGDALTAFKNADVHLDTAYKDFSLVQARFIQGDTLFPESLGGKEVQAQFLSQLPEIRKNITTVRSLLGVLPGMLGGEKPHAYAIALLDSGNIRSSGGSVAAVAVVSVDKGKLLTLQVYSLSTLNQMLVGKVDAPDEIKTFLRSPTWNLADATWEVSYHKVTQQLLWFLGKQLDRPLDGALVIPSSTLPSFLQATGPLKISKTGETLSADTFRTSEESVIASLPQNPTALEEYYANVFSAVLAQFQKGEEGQLGRLLGVMIEKLMGADVSLSVADANAERAFSAFSWDNVPLTPACPPEFVSSLCSVNTAYEVENSLGENAVGGFIKRSHVHTIRVGSEVLLHNRILTLTNTSSLLAWPYGTYQTLVKLLVDEQAQIQSVSINDISLSPDKFSLIKEDGKLVIRLPVEVAPTATTRVRFVYTMPGIPETNSSLVFFEQKQAGTGDDPFSLIITYPEKYAPKSVAPRADVGRTSLTFTSKHDANRLYGVGF